MSDVINNVLFEHPLNEKMRTWLRIEFLIQQLQQYDGLSGISSALAFFHTVADLLDILERGEVRTDLLKDLEHQQRKLQQWVKVPGVDTEMIKQLQLRLKEQAATLMSSPRIGQLLRGDRLITSVRQRLNIPGGCCCFDLPILHLWLHQALPIRMTKIQLWMGSLLPLTQGLALTLDLMRNSAQFRPINSVNGFYQDNAEGTDMLRLQLPLDVQLYPQVSGHKTRFSIRFLPFDSEHGTIPEHFIFHLACC